MVATLAKIGRWLRDAWLLIGIAVVLFALLEGSLSVALRLQQRIAEPEPNRPDWRVDADAYPDRSWVTKYYEEFRASDAVTWRPYVYWRRSRYWGEYINVDRTGLRRIVAAPAPALDTSRAIRIFMFGGSALWGTGARDEFTIPSILARELAGRGVQADITNFGESGYVSTQEVIGLLLRLQVGDVPDVVIFYDGVNDTYSAYQQRVAGLPQNEFKRATEFNLSMDPGRLRTLTLRNSADSLATVQVLTGLLRKIGLPVGPASRPRTTAELAGNRPAGEAGVAEIYFGNLELLRALAEHYHFAYRLYWQPTIFQKGSLTAYEEAERAKAKGFENFFREAYAVVRQRRPPNGADSAFRDLSLVFADVRQPVFVDWAHLGESGNETVARIMAGDLGALVQTRPAARTHAPR